MHFVVTLAGQDAIEQSNEPLVLDHYSLGDGFGYNPNPSQVALQGTELHSGVPSNPVIISNNLTKYTLVLGADLGDFAFGEVGLWLPGGVLFAVGSNSIPIVKNATSPSTIGNEIVVDCYVSTVGTNYAIYAEYGNSNHPMNLLALPGIDSLPAAPQAFPNVFIAGSPDNVNSVFAFSNNAIWSISGYEEIIATGLVNSATALSVNSSVGFRPPAYSGEYVLQFTSGVNLGVVRTVSGYNPTGNVISLFSVMNTLPQTNDTFQILRKTTLRPHIAQLLNELSETIEATHINPLEFYNLADFIHKNGTVAMEAPLNINGFRVIGVATPQLPTDAANKDYVDMVAGSYQADLNAILAAIALLNSTYFRKDGSLPMTGHFQAAGFRLTQLGTPLIAGDATNKGYVDALFNGLAANLVHNHEDLGGLQGGAPNSRYHFTLAEHTWLTNLVANGFPTASYSQAGISAFATSVEVGVGNSNSKGITPESLRLALQATGGPSPLQTAVLALLSLYAAQITFGSGAPNGGTPTYPPVYANISTDPYTVYFCRLGVWYPINPVATTSRPGIIEIATQAEVNAGVDPSRAVTPATLASYVLDHLGNIPVDPVDFSAVSQRDVVRYSSGSFTRAIASGGPPHDLAVGIADVEKSVLVIRGIVTGFSGLTVDAAYWLSSSVPGGITDTMPPGDPVRIGVAKSATDLFVDIDPGGFGGAGGGDQPTGGGTDKIFFTNSQHITFSYTLPVGKNAVSSGPIITDPGAVVTIAPGSRWVIV